MSGQKIIDGLHDALLHAQGDETSGVVETRLATIEVFRLHATMNAPRVVDKRAFNELEEGIYRLVFVGPKVKGTRDVG